MRAQERNPDLCIHCRAAKRKRGKTCPIHHDGPPVLTWLGSYIDIWARVQRYGALPDPGGVLDQEERTMRILDIIGDEVERHRKRKDELEAQKKGRTGSREEMSYVIPRRR